MRNIKLVLEYRGSNYHGWQRQKGRVTIQSILEELISRITGEKIKVISAGRTDAGVHAMGQVAAFRTESKHSPQVFKRALNSLLPEDIRIINVEEAEETFHPRFSAKAKSYIYFVSLDQRPSVFVADFCWTIKGRLDIDAMKEASQYIIGRHDFAGFRAKGCGARTTTRSIFEFSIDEYSIIPFMGIDIEGTFIRFRIKGDAFLRYMVRNIVGTLVEIGKGKRGISSIKDIFSRGDRRLAGVTAPAKGLFLEKVYY
ncbi:MAG: tRNA pseudouridine(38-40) synthase TruA [Thermodesulfovibrionales bacterium]